MTEEVVRRTKACPGCGLWIVTETHLCSATGDYIFCPDCGKKVAKKSHHTCISIQDMLDKYLDDKKGHIHGQSPTADWHIKETS